MITLSELCKRKLYNADSYEFKPITEIDEQKNALNSYLSERIIEYRKRFGDTLSLQSSKNCSCIHYFTILNDNSFIHKKFYITSVEFCENGIYTTQIYNTYSDVINNNGTNTKIYLGSIEDIATNNYNHSKTIIQLIDKAFNGIIID